VTWRQWQKADLDIALAVDEQVLGLEVSVEDKKMV